MAPERVSPQPQGPSRESCGPPDVPRLYFPHGNVPSYTPGGSLTGAGSLLCSPSAQRATCREAGAPVPEWLTLARHPPRQTLCRASPVPRLPQSPDDLLRAVLLLPRFKDEVVNLSSSGNCEIH